MDKVIDDQLRTQVVCLYQRRAELTLAEVDADDLSQSSLQGLDSMSEAERSSLDSRSTQSALSSLSMLSPIAKNVFAMQRKARYELALGSLLGHIKKLGQGLSPMLPKACLNLSVEELSYLKFLACQITQQTRLGQTIQVPDLMTLMETLSQANTLYDTHRHEYVNLIRHYCHEHDHPQIALDLMNNVLFDFTRIDEHQLARKLIRITEQYDLEADTHKHVLYRLALDIAQSDGLYQDKAHLDELVYGWAKYFNLGDDALKPAIYFGFLLSKGLINPASKTWQGETLLHAACKEGNELVAVNLVEFSLHHYPKGFGQALLTMKNNQNHCPEQLARLAGRGTIAQYLRLKKIEQEVLS